MRQASLLVAACAFAGAAAAEDVRLCDGRLTQAVSEGRLLNHFPYPVAARADLVRSPGLPGRCQGIHHLMRADLAALLARARADPEVGNAIIAISCFRSRRHQHSIFCRRAGPPQVMAWQVAPPGFSEHATGLAIDFGDRRGGRCNLEACFASTAVGRWLARNAPDFGFEMSFPEGNAQGVAFEPWHWRWVGRGDDGLSQQARTVFAAARERFPAAGTTPSAATRPIGAATPATPSQPVGIVSGVEQ